jgi:hypothetical protein
MTDGFIKPDQFVEAVHASLTAPPAEGGDAEHHDHH